MDDSPTIRMEVRILLNQLGIMLYEAGNGIGMFNQIECFGRQVDLIIMDLSLKEENGFDLIKKIKQIEAYQHIPIIMLTEHADANNVLLAKQLGVEGYIRKPLVKSSFVTKIHEILALSK